MGKVLDLPGTCIALFSCKGHLTVMPVTHSHSLHAAEDARRCDCATLRHALAMVPGAARMVVGHTIQVRASSVLLGHPPAMHYLGQVGRALSCHVLLTVLC